MEPLISTLARRLASGARAGRRIQSLRGRLVHFLRRGWFGFGVDIRVVKTGGKCLLVPVYLLCLMELMACKIFGMN
jgi:hypothetical protein